MWDVPHNLPLGCQNKEVKPTIRMCQDIDKHNAIRLVMQTTKTDIDKCKAWSICQNSS